ncbi:MAG TPA: dissimilatory-type sulfite reductase subunit alpha [Selenomonadales bacterium]|nr:dissimilatory-type sulfite reductase subunit alpha [Selenomonadales bacterium]
MADSKTPCLDELEKGAWPSFVTEMKKAAAKKASSEDLLGQLELSYQDKIGYWKHGGIVGVKGYGGGVIGRYSAKPEQFPHVKEFHTFRVNQVPGFFYSTKALRELCAVWDEYGSGLTNMHGSTGDIILLGTNTENLQPCFDALSEQGWDLGGSGGGLRTPSGCVGMARCEFACIDSMDIIQEITRHFQDALHRPAWPYKFKIKCSACANDCTAATARSDFAIIGTWRDTLRIDQEAVREYVAGGFDLHGLVVGKCPTKALEWNDSRKELKFYAEDCVRCMNCIDRMPKAIRPGLDRGASILIGGKAPVVKSAFIGWVLVPFMKVEPPYTELFELITRVTEYFDEHAKSRERIGELIYRIGMGNFLRGVGLPPVPQMVSAPRANPYIFWQEEEVVQHG